MSRIAIRAFGFTILALFLAISGEVRAAQTANLAELIAGLGPNGNGTLVEGDKVFSDFGLFVRTNSGGADAPFAEDIQATTVVIGGNIGLLWNSARWNVDSGEFMDTGWSYTVTAVGGPLIVDAELGLLSYATDGTSEIHITDSLSNGVNLLVEAPNGPTFDRHVFDPVRMLRVNKNVSLEGHGNGQAALSTFFQTYSQTPEPSTLATAGLAVVFGLGAWARRRRTAN
ncbi:MAG: PEP-CTERM sorting domain-containing protein [Isosphaeraceae bacterium]|nr:PEP-CTERM sorting domain-containing protein [Isosphaeraceae bacterium]